MQEEHCTKAVTRNFLFFNPFTCILFFQSCSTHSLNMPHNIFDVFEVQQQEELGSQPRASGARMPHSDRQRPVSAMRHVRRTGGMAARRDSARRRRWRLRQPAPYNADVSTASNSGSLAQMSVALHRKASAHCTTLRRDPLLLLRTCITEKTYFWLAIIFFLHLVYRSNEDTQNVSVVKSQ